jgi:site-specific recombinase XerD
MEISSELIKSRPTLSSNSIKTYSSILRNLYKKVYGDDEMTMDGFKNTEKILDFLKDIPANRRKTILSALVVLTNIEQYRHKMDDDIVSYNKAIALQTCTPAQEHAWVDTKDINEVYEDLKKNANALMKLKNITPSNLQEIQNYVIVSLLGGVYIPPRRLLDYVAFKIKNVDKKIDNYLDKSSLVFNKFKTAKTYGQQIVDIPKELKSILTKWIKLNPTDWLFFDSNLGPLNSVKLNQRLSKIFKNVATNTSVNALRHSYLTNKFGHTINQKKEIDDIMEKCGSSAHMLTTYVKDINL